MGLNSADVDFIYTEGIDRQAGYIGGQVPEKHGRKKTAISS